MRGTLAISGEMEGSLTEDEKSTLLLPPLPSSRLEREGGRERGRERGREGREGGRERGREGGREGQCLAEVAISSPHLSSTVNLASVGTDTCRTRNGCNNPTAK